MKNPTRPPVVSDPSPVVTIINNHAITTSLDVARVFEKSHNDVLKAIRKTIEEISNDFHVGNFSLVEIIEENAIGGKVDKSYYEITKDGFVLLAMGFTGKKALQFKLAYIYKFNAMERTLLEQPAAPQPKQITLDEHAVIDRITKEIMARIGGADTVEPPRARYSPDPQEWQKLWDSIAESFGMVRVAVEQLKEDVKDMIKDKPRYGIDPVPEIKLHYNRLERAAMQILFLENMLMWISPSALIFNMEVGNPGRDPKHYHLRGRVKM